jgi:phenylpyruvate tautomerase PptA (4-oxalocrotonate tautomerase family)
MPHVIVKLWPGKSEQQKVRLSEEIVKDVMKVLNYGEESVSIAIEEVKHRIGQRRSTKRTSRTSGTSCTRNWATLCRPEFTDACNRDAPSFAWQRHAQH